MISPIDSPRGQSGFSEIYTNIDILATQTLFVKKFSPYTLKIVQITIMFKSFSNLIPIWKKSLQISIKVLLNHPVVIGHGLA